MDGCHLTFPYTEMIEGCRKIKNIKLRKMATADEATMAAAVRNAQRRISNVVLLTELGAVAFGNDPAWVHAAMRRALEMMSGFELDVRLVSYRAPSRALLQMAKDFE
jgi:pyruvate/2-oxoacid:ferredoxin oxidoreductase beta subunit